MKELEKLINSKHTNYGKISEHYKLCEVVTKANPEQVLRYISEELQGTVEPLWLSDEQILD